jgi:hypothetical protein
MKTIIKSYLTIALLSLCACEFNASTGSGNKTAENLKAVSESKEPIRNAIGLDKQGGLEVKSAFVMTDDGALVPQDNMVKQGSRLKLVLNLKGWKAADGKVQIGAAQQLINSNNVVMMRNDDLFGQSTAISVEDAEVITLIMEVLNTKTIYDYYQTDFKVWNKNADQMIRGSYRFKLEK